MNKGIITTVSTLSLSMFLVACGGGSSSDVAEEIIEETIEETVDDAIEDAIEDTVGETVEDIIEDVIEDTVEESTPSGSSVTVSGVSSVVPFTSAFTNTFESEGVTFTITQEGGFDGDIEATSETTDFGVASITTPIIKLADGVPSLNITDVQRVQAIDVSCSNGLNTRGTITTDFSSGVTNISGTQNGQSLSCTATFNSPLPTTISDSSSVVELLEFFGNDTDLSSTDTGIISTDCPQGDDDQIGDFDITVDFCTGEFLTNYTVTDDTNKVHRLSTLQSSSNN